MPGMRRLITIAALLTLPLLPVAAVLSRVAVAASPMEAGVAGPLVTMVSAKSFAGAAVAPEPMLPEPGMLVLVGSGLLGLAFILSTTTRT